MAFTEAELEAMRQKRDFKKEEAAAGRGGSNITGYTILSNKTEAGLELEVRKRLNMGWEPSGGVSAAAFGISPVGGNRFVQAMIKRGGVRDRMDR